ncbi:hypothetical protein [endosymbiont of Ridgeia piscesae]|uniref:Archaeal/vacuolar-type H+-ATPase subunit E/Vma4 n=1 Tax=endosymbiont of Ridgeia piscesae TaxID=54398 RepID=A0A0T5Z5T9_9GAMM|nr:hypothetical protein [endosymbiont of Ridgeia piscesae]KRT54817.1 Archaeal/vacuolar-type H+-ATPase subunit E/Vma4 [endosymbiont of Ridgeia piscesae]KRT58282.1 V/A-type H+-transporting ATPase subunit E [endosymbiont of Ridgeia piscesae]
MAKQDQALQVSSGVEALIERLHDEGVAAGQERAKKIVADAEHQAAWIIEQAELESEQLRREARESAEKTRKALQESLAVAVRDAILSLKSTLTARFAEDVQRAVGEEMSRQEMLQRLILEVAGRTREQLAEDEPLELLLPRDVVGLEQLRKDPEALRASPLTELSGLITKEMLRDGVSFGEADDQHAGIRLSIRDGAIQLDLSDVAVTRLLLAHLQPRFRALVEGIVG